MPRIPNNRRGRRNGKVAVIIYPLGEEKFTAEGHNLMDLVKQDIIKDNHKVLIDKQLIARDDFKKTILTEGDVIILDSTKEHKGGF
jgi:ribosomal protein L14E/L6E/L27E